MVWDPEMVMGQFTAEMKQKTIWAQNANKTQADQVPTEEKSFGGGYRICIPRSLMYGRHATGQASGP